MHRRSYPVVATAVAVTMLAAACGGSDADTSSTDESPPETAAPESVVEPLPESDDESESSTDGRDTPEPPAEPEREPEPEPEPVVSDSTTSAIAASSYLGDYDLVDEAFGTMVTVTVDDGVRTIESNAIPNHETGEFPNSGNPNEISEQALSFSFTTTPEYGGSQTFAQTPGIAANGVTFEPGTAETATCSSGETYRVEALQELYDLGLDVNNAHVQPTGHYHYHGVSELLVGAFDDSDGSADVVHVGFAADGFLIYYSMSGAYGSGYTLSTEERTGTDCVVSGQTGSIGDLEGTTPDGTYSSDWVWSDDVGDLDECNGTFIDGEYAYFITDEYPYIGRCLNGTDVSGQPGGGAGGAPPDGAGNGEPAQRP